MKNGTFGKCCCSTTALRVPELPLDKFHLCAIRWNWRKDTLRKSVLWIFQDLPVIRPNQTARGMMPRHFEILVEHWRGLIFWSTQRQERLAGYWELMPQFYLILWLEVVQMIFQVSNIALVCTLKTVLNSYQKISAKPPNCLKACLPSMHFVDFSRTESFWTCPQIVMVFVGQMSNTVWTYLLP